MSPLTVCWSRICTFALVGTFVTAAAQAGAEEGADQLGLPPMMHGTHLSHADYTLPGVQLVREDGRHVALKDELDDGHPVIVSFVYTSCSSLCPMISRTLSQLQGKLGAERDTVHLLSISIDPEQDTPQRLREYAAEVGAGAGWHHYTGTVAASVATQKAFNVYREDKMSHRPVLLMRAAPGKRWLRIDGFATADELLQAYRGMMAAN